MTDTITLNGIIGSPPKHLITAGGIPITSFRLATHHRRFDEASKQWVDAETNWYKVSTYRQLALNCASSLQQGDHILLTGRLHIRPWKSNDKSGINVDIDADSLGHDLTRGTAKWVRGSNQAAQAQPSSPAAAQPGTDDGDYGFPAAAPAAAPLDWASGVGGPAPERTAAPVAIDVIENADDEVEAPF